MSYCWFVTSWQEILLIDARRVIGRATTRTDSLDQHELILRLTRILVVR